MKNIIFKQLAVCAAAFLAVSCIDRNFDKPAAEYGTLSVSSVGITEDLREKGHSTRAEADMDVSNFKVRITSKEGEVIEDCVYGDLKAQYQLYAGDYTIYVESHEVKDAAWEEVHYSVSQDFSIEKGRETTIEELVCKVTNILVSVRFHKTMARKMAEDCVVAIKIGGGSLNYGIDEARRGAFKDAAAGENVLVWDFKGTLDGEYFDQTDIIRNVKAGEHRTLTFNTETIERGNGQFVLVVSPEVEAYDINKNVAVGEEEVIVPFILPEIGSNYSLTERAVVKKSQESTATPASVNIKTERGLAGVAVELTTDNATLEQKLSSANVAKFDLAAVSTSIQKMMIGGVLGTMPFGDAVTGKKDITIKFDKLIAYVFNPANNITIPVEKLDIRITATDAEGFSKTETLRMKFVDDTVAVPVSITGVVNGAEFDIDQRQTVSLAAAPASLKAVIDVPAGIRAFEVNMGATPEGGEFDSTLKTMSPVDLVNDANGTVAQLAEGGIYLPFGSEVANKTNVEFEIASFITFFRLYIDGGEFDADFTLTVTDNNGIEGIKTLKLHITE